MSEQTQSYDTSQRTLKLILEEIGKAAVLGLGAEVFFTHVVNLLAAVQGVAYVCLHVHRGDEFFDLCTSAKPPEIADADEAFQRQGDLARPRGCATGKPLSLIHI